MRIGGEALDQVAQIVFLGAPGTADDRVAPAVAPSPGAVGAQVPTGASSGPVLVVNGDGNTSAPTRSAVQITAGGVAAPPDGVEARIETARVFFAGRRRARMSYFVRESAAVTVQGEVVRIQDGRVLASFPATVVPGRTVQTLEWDGTVRGRVPKDGRYLFRVRVTRDGGATAAQAGDEPPTTSTDGNATVVEQQFTFLREMFPIRGRHVYGTGAAAFGAARGGEGHKGQDVFARCGTRLVAARGGIVKFAGFHSRAGNYVVIDGDGTGFDYVYMHLKDEVTFGRGDRVFTGQPIGAVGDTGRADGCHLHFELWSKPGWYTGGSAVDPNPSLLRWDRLT